MCMLKVVRLTHEPQYDYFMHIVFIPSLLNEKPQIIKPYLGSSCGVRENQRQMSGRGEHMKLWKWSSAHCLPNEQANFTSYNA